MSDKYCRRRAGESTTMKGRNKTNFLRAEWVQLFRCNLYVAKRDLFCTPDYSSLPNRHTRYGITL